MATIFFISDTHFGHEKVARLRGFNSSVEHDEFIVSQVNKYVSTDDVLIHLGDVTMGNIHYVGGYLRDFPVKPHLIIGNHDNYLWKFNKNKYDDYLQYFSTIRQFSSYDIFLISHFPYGDDAFLMDRGMPLIHGHTHSTEKLSYSEAGTPQVCVCWDAWNQPVSLSEIKKVWREA